VGIATGDYRDLLMTKFFIPGNTPQRSEEIYEWIVRYVKEMTDSEIEPVRIYSLDYTHEGQQFRATVGEEEPRTGQLVIAILRSTAYLICTPYYGVRRGEPMRVEPSEVSEVQYFEGLDRAREKFRAAVQILDNGSGSTQSRLQAAALTLDPLLLDDFPTGLAGDFLSLKHKLGWRGSQDDTISQMTDAEAEDAASAIRALYVDVLRPADA
jgi:hypothetical protein